MGVAPAPACLNCGTPLAGEFCFACGQRDLPPEPTLGELLSEAWDAFVSIDGKVFASVRLLLTRPGALTTEYVAGHRARFLPPLRLYLVCSVLYFLTSAALPDHPPAHDAAAARRGASSVTAPGTSPQQNSADAVARHLASRRDSVENTRRRDSLRRDALAWIGRPSPAGPLDSASTALGDSLRLERQLANALGPHPGWLKRAIYTRVVRNGERIVRDKKHFGDDFKAMIPRLMFVLMPAFGLLLALAYRSRRRRYPTHLIVSLHIHAFAFAALTIGALVSALPESPFRSTGLTIVTLWMLAYVPLAFRRVYGGRMRAAIARSLVLETTYFFLAIVAVAAGAVVMVALY